MVLLQNKLQLLDFSIFFNILCVKSDFVSCLACRCFMWRKHSRQNWWLDGWSVSNSKTMMLWKFMWTQYKICRPREWDSHTWHKVGYDIERACKSVGFKNLRLLTMLLVCILFQLNTKWVHVVNVKISLIVTCKFINILFSLFCLFQNHKGSFQYKVQILDPTVCTSDL